MAKRGERRDSVMREAGRPSASVSVGKVFIPGGEMVLVKKMADERQTASGIILPDTAAPGVVKAEVVSTGPGLKTAAGLIPVQYKAGDIVLYANGINEQDITIDGVEHTILRERDILGCFPAV